ncbi:hypothetical protein PoB_004513300 [Plakobranchus ocellatus]|uniref:Uncharacterized protein n=1 Tax=Plakobranchus ocellatus TaxID=259542 RepID=A0AAV4BIJ8_9GAST|nr:hypothetical protein PoB_004513300 [Plakobranchus ocellatus]
MIVLNATKAAIGFLSVSVLLACASIGTIGSPGPLSGLKSTCTCTDNFGHQKPDILQDFDNDVFLAACIWVGFCCKCLGLLSALFYKCKMDKKSCVCQIISPILTSLSVLCVVVEFFDIVVHSSMWEIWEYHGDYKKIREDKKREEKRGNKKNEKGRDEKGKKRRKERRREEKRGEEKKQKEKRREEDRTGVRRAETSGWKRRREE